MSEAMTINDIINQLGSLRASSAEFAKSDPENEIWKTDVTACETAIRILAALSGEGCTDLETTLDFLQDYKSLAKQYQTLPEVRGPREANPQRRRLALSCLQQPRPNQPLPLPPLRKEDRVALMGRVERWRDIPGYDGWYQISTEGRVRSYRAYGPGNRLEEPRELHPRLRNTSHGPYLVVALKVDAKTQRTHTMTRLMAETWMKNLPPDYIILLKNGNPADVSLSNMVVSTRAEQRERARAAMAARNRKPYCKKLPVVKIDLTLEVVDAYPSARQAALDTTINRGTIQLYCNHKTKKSVIAPDGFIYAWDDTRSIWATMRRAMRELDEMGIRYNDPFTGRYFDIPPHVDFDLDPTLWWAEASSGGGGGGTHSDP